MSIFNLPDLGEGLPDAEIHEWYVKVGDQVTVDQPLVAMETAKAVVDVPASQSGIIAKLYGQTGDIIKTGHPLIEFAGDAEQSTSASRNDEGTVVGSIEATGQTVQEQFIIGRQATTTTNAIKATPAVRALAKKLNVDLAHITATGANGAITRADVEQQAKTTGSGSAMPPADFTPLKGTRRTMATLMSQSHQQVAPVTIYDDAILAENIHGHDITVHLIQTVISAAAQEPALNAWYDGLSNSRCLKNDVNLGLAVDSDDGLFVPVIKAAQQLNPNQLRQTVDQFKQQV
ncbi:MAG: 2-oxo acid dehydrogenase subunit E2, partial [Legionellales bacterium]|nr:2-oxo acid dehydrogenase subunit E2 [Legionellales bacterium]